MRGTAKAGTLTVAIAIACLAPGPAVGAAERQPMRTDRASLESVPISGPADLGRLESLGLDVTEDLSPDSATVVLYSDAQRELLASAGYDARTLVPDMAAASRADRAEERRAAADGVRSALPSGRDTYRVYSDYTTELQQLADANPGLVRKLVIGQSFEGRPIEGVEIASQVNRTDDGRPVYLNMGLHHAREWPSGEFPMEFALDLVNNYGSDPRITSLLDQVRVVIVPVVNPDGFIVSRAMGPGNDEDRRKNCRPTLGDAALTCDARAPFSGVDLNRNYGAYWGGAGASSNPSADDYRGAGPYSEPESQAVHAFTSALQPTVFITNHTFTDDGEWLRQPGFDAAFLPHDSLGATTPDEAGMASLGDAMAGATGWSSLRSWTLGDITGAAEDWNYFAQGTYGYTPEARGTGFHDNYADAVVTEYLGDSGHAGLGVREAFLIAGERAANPADHSVIEGSAPAGATLRLHKEFETPTSQALTVHDVLDTTLTAPTSGSYEWHVNPSSRPLVPGEKWAMSCEQPGQGSGSTEVAVARGAVAQVSWDAACKPAATGSCKGRKATIIGTNGNDRGAKALVGTSHRDVIAARGGKDKVVGRGGKDLICGERGKDLLRGGAGPDTLVGGKGGDRLFGNGGRDKLRGGPGRDRCRGGAGRDSVRGCA